MTSFILKIIALLSMLSDHCTDVFGWSAVGNDFGRLAFPLYAFMIVDSFRHLSCGAKGVEASDRVRRGGAMGWLRCGLDAMRKKTMVKLNWTNTKKDCSR